MATMLVTFDGGEATNGSPLLMHNERLADPLDLHTIEIAKISGKRKKVEADHLEIARLEFAGGMYHDDEVGPFIPGWNVIRCLQDAAKRHKLGQDVLRGMVPIMDKVPVQYDGPRDIEAMWRDGSFALRKTVGVNRSRVARTRPCFTDWKLEAEIELDVTVLNPNKIDQFAEEAGRYVGIGDNRPIFGRFTGSAVLLKAKKAEREAVAS